jgi:DNA-binding transcriptional LysR family regulator
MPLMQFRLVIGPWPATLAAAAVARRRAGRPDGPPRTRTPPMRRSISLQSLATRLRFRHLVLIDALGRSRNMHIAAQQMNITQPAATKILHDVEEILDLPLFERLPREMRPTELGEQVIRFARETLNATGKFAEELDHLRRGGHGLLLIGATYGTAHILSAAIMRLKEKRPLLSIRVLERTSDLLVAELEQKTIDVVIGRFTDETQHNIFDFRPIAATPMCIVVSPNHPLLGAGDLTLDQLMTWPWVVHPLGTPTRKLFEATLADHGLECPVNLVETTSIFATLSLLQGTDMVAILPVTAVADFVERQMLARLPIRFEREVEDYGILTRKHEVLSSAALDFVAAVTLVTRDDAGTTA